LNPRPPGPQPDALPTELHSPPSVSLSAPALRQLQSRAGCLARQKGFEPLTHGLEGRCSFHLSYWRESGRADLNGRPPAPKAGALPGCATPRTISINTRKSAPQPRARAHAPRRRCSLGVFLAVRCYLVVCDSKNIAQAVDRDVRADVRGAPRGWARSRCTTPSRTISRERIALGHGPNFEC
jgi:hypothetical protein